jgi:hypothetical protein
MRTNYPPGVHHSDLNAPWNKPDYIAPLNYCEVCRRCEEEQGVGTLTDNTCDDCHVDNARACGDWDAVSIAGAHRIRERGLKVTAVTFAPESATRRVINALDIIDHARRRWKATSDRRIETMRYFLTEYGYAERKAEERERALVELSFALQGMADAFKPNTYRK